MYTDGHRDPSPEDLLAHLQNEIASIYEDGETIDDVDRIFIYTPDQAVYLLNYLERKWLPNSPPTGCSIPHCLFYECYEHP